MSEQASQKLALEEWFKQDLVPLEEAIKFVLTRDPYEVISENPNHYVNKFYKLIYQDIMDVRRMARVDLVQYFYNDQKIEYGDPNYFTSPWEKNLDYAKDDYLKNADFRFCDEEPIIEYIAIKGMAEPFIKPEEMVEWFYWELYHISPTFVGWAEKKLPSGKLTYKKYSKFYRLFCHEQVEASLWELEVASLYLRGTFWRIERDRHDGKHPDYLSPESRYKIPWGIGDILKKAVISGDINCITEDDIKYVRPQEVLSYLKSKNHKFPYYLEEIFLQNLIAISNKETNETPAIYNRALKRIEAIDSLVEDIRKINPDIPDNQIPFTKKEFI